MTTELKLSVPLWYPGLTSEDRLRIERIQKSACGIILGQEYQSYKRALKQLGLDTLHERRNKLCKTFSKKAQKHTKFKKWFKPNEKTSCTRNIPARFCDVYARTERFKQSPVSYLTNILLCMGEQQMTTLDLSYIFPFLFPLLCSGSPCSRSYNFGHTHYIRNRDTYSDTLTLLSIFVSILF